VTQMKEKIDYVLYSKLYQMASVETGLRQSIVNSCSTCLPFSAGATVLWSWFVVAISKLWLCLDSGYAKKCQRHQVLILRAFRFLQYDLTVVYCVC
jgi:hypothetical protein